MLYRDWTRQNLPGAFDGLHESVKRLSGIAESDERAGHHESQMAAQHQ